MRKKAAVKICVIVEIETADPLLMKPPDVSTVEAVSALRSRVIAALPRDISRIVAVMPVEMAEMIMQAHDVVHEAMGGEAAHRPPKGWKTPRERH